MSSAEDSIDRLPWYRGPAFYLLVSLTALYIVLPAVNALHAGNQSQPFLRILPGILVSCVLVLGVRAVTRARRAVLVAAVTAIAGLGLAYWSVSIESRHQHPGIVGLASLGTFALFMLFSTLSVFRVVIRNERVHADKIFAALCVYLLLGFTFAFVYTFLVGLTTSELFRFPEASSGDATRMGDLIYFSFTTLTTLGYGDVVPSSPVTRSLATFEALTGQFYIGVLVARLVSLQLVHSKHGET